MLGICGVYCEACPTYRAYNDNDQALIEWEIKMGMPRSEIFCKGCHSDIVNEWCSKCDFRKCVNEKRISYCFECSDFPCQKLIKFSKTRPHRTLGLNNLKQLRAISIEEWLKVQKKRWICASCERKLHWYSEKCPDCGSAFVNATKEASSLDSSIRKENVEL